MNTQYYRTTTRDFAGSTSHNNHIGELIGIASRKVLKSHAKFTDFRNSLLKQEGKIRGELKLKDLEIHVGIERTTFSSSSKSSPDDSPAVEAVRRVFRAFAKTNRYGDVRVHSYWLKSLLTHPQKKKRPHGMDEIMEGSINLCRSSFESAQKTESSRRKLTTEGVNVCNRPNYFFVGICTGMYDLNLNLSDRVRRMYRKRNSASNVESTGVCVARGDLFPKFEVSMSPPVHVPVLREPYLEKSQNISRHESYIRNEIEYDRYVSRRWYVMYLVFFFLFFTQVT